MEVEVYLSDLYCQRILSTLTVYPFLSQPLKQYLSISLDDLTDVQPMLRSQQQIGAVFVVRHYHRLLPVAGFGEGRTVSLGQLEFVFDSPTSSCTFLRISELQ